MHEVNEALFLKVSLLFTILFTLVPSAVIFSLTVTYASL